MTKLRKQLTILLTIFAVAGLAQCSGTTNSGKTKLKILTPDPVVINAPITLSQPIPADAPPGTLPVTLSIAANWYLINIEVDNNSPEVLYLVNFDLNMTGINSNGVTQSSTGNFNVGFTCSPLPGALIASRNYVAILNPGGIYTHLGDTTGCDPSTAVGGAPAESWYIGNLDATVVNWTVQVVGQGWFQDPTTGEANERLVMYDYFTTQ